VSSLKPNFAVSTITVTPLSAHQCADVVALVHAASARGFLLERSLADVQTHQPNFLTAAADGRVIGCVALRDFGAGLHELRTLAVAAEAAGHGVGGKLVAGAIALGRSRGAHRIFALARRPDLFVRCGFERADKEWFPQKVWSDCRLCPRRECCDEEALFIDLA
jgi:N-acetylglutamate synthase-like GNAT family acetyltransferase